MNLIKQFEEASEPTAELMWAAYDLIHADTPATIAADPVASNRMTRFGNLVFTAAWADAAMMLVRKGTLTKLSQEPWASKPPGSLNSWFCTLELPGEFTGYGKTMATSIVIACLKAREQ